MTPASIIFIFLTIIALAYIVIGSNNAVEEIIEEKKADACQKANKEPEVKQPNTRNYPEGYGFDDGPVF